MNKLFEKLFYFYLLISTRIYLCHTYFYS